MKYSFLQFTAACIAFFALDMLWLGLIAKNFYRTELQKFLSPEVNWPAAIIFYLIYIAGILFFAVQPALQLQSLQKAIINGAFLGFLCYCTYDLTNMATMHNWPLKVVIVDVIWGTILTAAVSAATYFVSVKFL